MRKARFFNLLHLCMCIARRATSKQHTQATESYALLLLFIHFAHAQGATNTHTHKNSKCYILGGIISFLEQAHTVKDIAEQEENEIIIPIISDTFLGNR